jgi:hypothetical protein
MICKNINKTVCPHCGTEIKPAECKQYFLITFFVDAGQSYIGLAWVPLKLLKNIRHAGFPP